MQNLFLAPKSPTHANLRALSVFRRSSRSLLLARLAVVAVFSTSFLASAHLASAQAQEAEITNTPPISSTRNNASTPTLTPIASSIKTPILASTATEKPAASTASTVAVPNIAVPNIAVPIIVSFDEIAINVNGRVVSVNPAPVLQDGSVLVPLRGVLENLGATVSFNAQTRGILVSQEEKRVVLLLDSRQATIDGKAISLSAAPQIIGGSTYVPLRSLAQLFGYQVQWLPASRTISIVNASGAAVPTSNHRQALRLAGRLGIGISLVEGDATIGDSEAERLLDAAKDAGASLIKIRFDWGTLEPKRGASYQWTFYDNVVAGARRRGLTVEGVLGQSAKWASTFSNSDKPELWRNGAPREKEMKAWQNYVKRVVGRYKNDVHAWQVWEKTSADRFRSSQNVYRKFLLNAAQAARQSDAKAIVFAAEPGGIDLDVIDSLSQSAAAPLVDGVTVYPVSQNQPGSIAPSVDFLRPYASLLTNADFGGGAKKTFRDFWVGGLSRPVLGENPVLDVAVDDAQFATKDTATRARLLQTFTPEAQADYLMQAAVLALAAGSDKVFWNELRDRADYESIAPINAEYNAGLLRRDFSPRPSFDAFKTLSKQVAGKKYIGSLALGPNVVALVFDDGSNASVAAWTTSGTASLIVNTSGQNPGVPNSLYVASVGETRVLDSVGNVLGNVQFNGALTTRPVWISNVGYETRQSVIKPDARGLVLERGAPTFDKVQGVSAEFSMSVGEAGLYWRKFSQFRGAANQIVEAGDRSGLKTEVSRNVLDPAAGKFFVFLDVDDDYLYLARDVPVELTVTVKRPAPETRTLVGAAAGFNIEYSTSSGTGRTPWQIVEAGDGWATFTFTLPNASFSNRGGYDLLLNTFGSKKDLIFGSVALRRWDSKTTAN